MKEKMTREISNKFIHFQFTPFHYLDYENRISLSYFDIFHLQNFF